MRADIRGLVERLDLSSHKGLIPLFEALSNAIDAIEERYGVPQRGRVVIRVVPTYDLASQGADREPLVDGFEISDDGIGFTEANITSFGDAYTLSKVKIGGRGIGRFTYLKVFNEVAIRSVFEKEGQRWLRQFRFSIDNEIHGSDIVAATNEPIGTTVRVTGLKQKYQVAWPHEAGALARRVIEHFLIRFAARLAPSISLAAPSHPPINLNELYDSTVSSTFRNNHSSLAVTSSRCRRCARAMDERSTRTIFARMAEK